MSSCESWEIMVELNEVIVSKLGAAQSAELSLLVELEARWENLRKTPARPQEGGATTQNLLGIQKAYDLFRGKLAAYNKQFTPAHVTELLLNTPSRLGVWCRSMCQLFLRVEHDPRVRCPLQLLEKAYRLAERVGARLERDRLPRPTPPATIRAAAQDLEALGRWCDDLAAGRGPSPPESATTLPEAPQANPA
jgi:hypothetical protein